MNSPFYAVDLRSLAAVLATLFLFGCGYAWLVYWLGERKTGYVASFVVLGVLVTLGMEALLNTWAAILSLICFSASGAPMVAGEIIGHMRSRERAIRMHQERALDHIEGIQDERTP